MAQAQIIDSAQDETHGTTPEEGLASWVIAKVDDWRDDYRANHQKKDDEFNRLFRGIWKEEDKTRSTERSRIISPAIQQAVESNVAEIEEATFGRGEFFDIVDDKADEDQFDVAALRTQLHEDFNRLGTKQKIAEIILNAAIYGTGIGELVLDTIKETVPAQQGQQVGVMETEREVVKLVPVLPKHFLIDPAADGIAPDSALGCAIDKEVPTHTIIELQEAGVYRDVEVGTDATEPDLQTDSELSAAPKGQTRLTKYFGKVPRKLLDAVNLGLADDEEVEDLSEDKKSKYVEAVVIIADGATLLKATENKNMMGDRNVVAFQWDKVSGKFRGRGTVEKGYNSQKALDAEIRARIDALGLTVHPMMGVDAARMPKGARPTIGPGKMILTNGNPKEVLHPFTFGQVGQITFQQAQALDNMVQRATGADEMSPGNINADQAASAMSQSRGGIVKRHKRTQRNFEESFLIPFISQTAWRYMQFDPDRFPARDLKFTVKGNLGIVAREYEVAQLVQLLQTVEDPKIKGALTKAVVDHMNVSNREEIKALLDEAATPTEDEVKAAEEARQAELRFKESQTKALEGQANESNKRARKYEAETLAVPVKLENDRIRAVATGLAAGTEDDRAFEQRFKVANLMLNEKKMGLPGSSTPSTS